MNKKLLLLVLFSIATFTWYANTQVYDSSRRQRISSEGAAADGATVAGNPVRIAGKDVSGNTQDVAVSSGGVLASTGTTTGADGVVNTLGLLVDQSGSIKYLGVDTHLFNSTTWDRERNNEDITVLASAARTAETDSADLTNFNARGLMLFVDVTSITSAPALTVNIQMKDPVASKYITIWTAAATITTATTAVYLIYPGAIAADYDGTEAVSIAVPRTWRVRVGVGNADSATYSIGASFIN